MYDSAGTDTSSGVANLILAGQAQVSQYGSDFFLRTPTEFILPPKKFLVDRTGVEFVKHAQKWKRETIHLSSPTQKYIHPSYARIIGLGLSVVPLILDDLRKQGGDWFYALRAITGENPVKTSMAGDMPKMTRAWLLWGAKRNY